MSTESNGRKITVTLPSTLIARLDGQVPPRQRSDFIARAIEAQLALLEQAAAIEEAAGAWPDEAYPDMRTDQDIDRWLAEVRGPAPEEA
jgi:Arc/MetJ-type ribon-helix-helix transcriptional regulator